MAVTDYKITRARGDSALETEIAADIVAGWEPQGGVVTEGPDYVQAMVKTV